MVLLLGQCKGTSGRMIEAVFVEKSGHARLVADPKAWQWSDPEPPVTSRSGSRQGAGKEGEVRAQNGGEGEKAGSELRTGRRGEKWTEE
ncbi:hypothetical protein E2C01_069318 [Portunus trituberculatus]|uniref:Uncharacterized protein n=1 Tax=Portunus trituberculatus TaxID=210409 RepID=A0A5B7I1V4_PORTR|nr:hypothetical protein [Portunus trituberculatus]